MPGSSSETEVRPQRSLAGQLFEKTRLRGGGGGGDDSSRLRILLGSQGLWMLCAFGTITVFEIWSLELYFVLSFIGLLINRVLFAPVGRRPEWWRILNVVTWFGFLVLSLILYSQAQSVISTP